MNRAKETPKFVRDPVDGSTLVAPAGGSVEAHFTCDNPGNPNVAVFTLEIYGLPEPTWAEYEPRGVAPEGEETLILKLLPPLDAAEGEYDLRVTLLMDNAVLRPAITLTLQVKGVVAPSYAVVATKAEDTRRAEDAERQRREAEDAERQRLEAEERRRSVQDAARQDSARQDSARQEEDRRLREEQERSRRAKEDEDRVRRAEEADRSRREKEEEEERLRSEKEEAERKKWDLDDPKDGTTLTLRPGEAMLVRFPVTNEMPREATYTIEHDGTPIVTDWIELTPDQCNVPRNGAGELGLHITVPLTARPGDYSFVVLIGPVGGTQTPRGLVLSVLPTPAVKLMATAPLVKVGPFARPVDFELKVSGDGNSDTAFRISVKTPQSAEQAAGHPALSDRYETDQWRYLFNKELDNVGVEERSSNPKQAAIQLRVMRKGIWWFGFTESHRFQAAAVPVTDPTNCGKTANRIELTAMRWRLLPFPPFLLLPLFLFVFLLASGGASDISVTNATYQADDGKYWVAEKGTGEKGENLTVQTEWEANPWDLVRLKARVGTVKAYVNQVKLGGGTYTDTVALPSTDKQFEEHTYEVTRAWGGAAKFATAVLVRTFDEKRLRLSATTNGRTISLTPDTNGSVNLPVPSQGVVKLTFTNDSIGDYEVPYHRVKDLAPTSPFKFQYAVPQGSIPIRNHVDITIEKNPDAAATGDTTPTDEIVYVTVSAKMPILHIKLEPGQ